MGHRLRLLAVLGLWVFAGFLMFCALWIRIVGPIGDGPIWIPLAFAGGWILTGGYFSFRMFRKRNSLPEKKGSPDG
jgi:hypothetical protein